MSDLMIVLVLLVAAIVMFAINKPRMDAVALIMLTVLPFTGVITMGEALAGFSDPNIVLIAALFVIGDGLVRTGVAQRLGDWLTAKAGSSETRLIVLLMAGGLRARRDDEFDGGHRHLHSGGAAHRAEHGHRPGRLMMPLSFAALISGMMTLVATAPNLVVNSELERHGVDGLSLLQLHAVRRADSGAGHRLHAASRVAGCPTTASDEAVQPGRASPTGSRNTSSPTASTGFA